jgi:hypothetical protein
MVDWGRTVGWTGGAVAAVEAVPLTCKVARGPIHVVPVHLAGSAGPAMSGSAGPRDEEAPGYTCTSGRAGPTRLLHGPCQCIK